MSKIGGTAVQRYSGTAVRYSGTVQFKNLDRNV